MLEICLHDRNRICFCLISFLLFCAGLPAAEQNLRLAVYFPDYRYQEGVKPPMYGTTNLILFSAKPNHDGSVDFSRVSPSMIQMAKTARLAPPLQVTFCVGGWGRGDLFAKAVSTPENRARFAASLASFCEKYDLDGVDIDWEFPEGKEQHSDFTMFLTALSARLHASDRILTVALGENRPLSPAAYEVVDQVNLMSYQPWHPQPYEEWLENAVKSVLESGLAPGKVNIGLGFFAREQGGEHRSISFSKLAGDSGQLLPNSEFGFSPVGKAACDLRFELVKKYRLGGIMVWDYGHDSPDPKHSLLRYISENGGRLDAKPR
jgi:GH18 family chitinase